jgi:hypothetical protein
MALVLALSSSAAQVSAAFVVGVRRRDHRVVLYRRCKAALIILSHSIVCVGGVPVDTDQIASLALTVSYLAGLSVFGYFEAATDPAATADSGGPADASSCKRLEDTSRLVSV